ncbi:PTS glucitol transporter subunit IIA [Pediococcus acidilactici]|uniref:PTS galactitol transporter subunit IIC n=1 Tax=Pediococcus acidilactici TaxID=1254 RepID=UPI0013239882|nr:PTS transporter subunit IIC [Pediococcus acidilactici]KAF0362816.1 PTS glucitol transporter subunit IIA [Pediococcus acidilactici]KAF0366297.1 PTS glucitol transporter subunit IIA [Pediococcus acidilactici]KAF0417420.1 PTS glucitol transporter subunit IIA [Pediococcus acidilactici]KAF0420811.1 PTS glucitol transporter subunit IIA [Pediococcus acidilactici]KAF0464835.1 PTS glucitol transporter subunit IIA [Pediococcus acidilactici]
MNGIIHFANLIFKPIIDLGAAPIMLIVLTLLAWALGVKFSKALEGGIKLAIALTGISAIINILTTAYQAPLAAFVKSTGINLSVTDVGWAPLATITWGSPYTLFFLLLMVILNLIMLALKWTNTLDVDVFDIWHISFTALMAMYFGANLLIAIILILIIGILKIINSDLMKPTFNDLLNAPDDNPMTTTHLNYMMNPIIMLFDKIFDKIFPWLDKYDFDSAELNKRIGFWGSHFAIGCYLGVFIGLVARQDPKEILTLAFTGGVCLQLFSQIGSWFIAAVEPLSQGVTDLANKHLHGRKLNIGLDWPFIAGRAEIWAAANVLAPVMLLEALVLPGNHILPLGGIIAMGVTPALLVVTRGKIIRMIVIGAIEMPIFLWAGTLSAPFITNVAKQVGAFPAGLSAGTKIAESTKEGPIEQFLAYLVGKASTGEITFMIYALLALVAYVLLFWWYAKQMKKRNAAYAAEKAANAK